jgi:hypothetical protein
MVIAWFLAACGLWILHRNSVNPRNWVLILSPASTRLGELLGSDDNRWKIFLVFCCHYKTICRSPVWSVSDASLFIITLSCLIQLHIKAAVGTAFRSDERPSNLRFCQNPLLIRHCTWHTKQDWTGTLHEPVQRRPCSKAFPCMLGHCGSFA